METRRRRTDEDFSDEVRAHIDLETDRLIGEGMSPADAMAAARKAFGSTAIAQERFYEASRWMWLDQIRQDLRYAARGFEKNPGFAAVAILSLAIGIGANTAIFSIVNAVLLQPLPFKDPQRVFVAREIISGLGTTAVNPVHARAWADGCPSIERVSVVGYSAAQIVAGGEPASIRSANVDHHLLPLLGIEPLLGRGFLAEEEQDGRQHVAMLSEALWRSRFNADPSLVGRSIAIDGQAHEVVGILPESFRLPTTSGRPDVFRPLVLARDEVGRLMGNYNYAAALRLRPAARPALAIAEMNVVQARFPKLAGVNTDLKATLIPAHEQVTGRARLGLWTLAAAVGAVLLIVCVNLANLLLSRMASRGREAAIRTALGASRARQFCQVMTESLLLSVSGGALGLLMASWMLQFLTGAAAADLPRVEEVRLDTSVLAFAFALTVFTGLLFGLLPAWRFTRHEPQEALRAGSRTSTEARGGVRVREALIGLEVGVSAALLIVAGLLTSSLTRLLQVDKGFEVDHVLTVDVGLAGSRYAEDATREQFFDRLLGTVAAIPGVQAAGAVTHLPTLGDSWNDPIYLEGAPREKRHTVNNRYTSPDYFRAMNIAIRAGRSFDARDRGQGVAVLSTKAAQLLWPGDPNPLGRLFMGEDDKLKTLVGIVADVRATLASDPPPTAYYPYWQRMPDAMSLVVRTAGDPQGAAGAVRTALRREDAQLPIPAIRTMDDVVDRSVAQRRFQMTLMIVFAVSALVVASLGIYGVVSYSVARRRSEIGIRMALGAQRSQLLGLVVRQGMTPVAIGLAGGIVTAFVVGRAIRGLLFGVQPADPLTIAAVTVVLLTVGAVACLVPARRATRADAVASLRLE